MHTPKTHLVFTHSGVMAWNIPAHMLSGAIAYQTLRHENPAKITTVTVVLRHYPSFETHWRAQFEGLPAADRDEIVFMFAARWADDLRTSDRSQQRGSWHYINWPFKPEGQPESCGPSRPGTKKFSPPWQKMSESQRLNPRRRRALLR